MSKLEASTIASWKMADFNKEAVEDLREHCDAAQLQSTGTKADLVCRLLDHYKARAEIKFKHILERSGLYKDDDQETGREMMKIIGIIGECQRQRNMAEETDKKQKSSIADMYKAAFDPLDGMEMGSVEGVAERLSRMGEIMKSLGDAAFDSHAAGPSLDGMRAACRDHWEVQENGKKAQDTELTGESDSLSSIGLPPTISGPFKSDEEMDEYNEKYCTTPPYNPELWAQEYLEEQLTRALLQADDETGEVEEENTLENADGDAVNTSSDQPSRAPSPLSSAPSSTLLSREKRTKAAEIEEEVLEEVGSPVKKRRTRGQAVPKVKTKVTKKGKRGGRR